MGLGILRAMRDLAPQIVVAVTALLSFAAGIVAEMVRHRLGRKARLQDERIAVYGRYVSALRQMPSILSAALYRTGEDLMTLTRKQEELVGPLRLYANDEVREALDEVSRARYHEVALALHQKGVEPFEAVLKAWGSEMAGPIGRLEAAMRRHLDLGT